MAHPTIDNTTPFSFEPLFIADEEGTPILATIVKATYAIDSSGELDLCEEQPPVDFSGRWEGDPAVSSIRYEPETAFTKPGTDVVLIGHAHARHPRTTELAVAVAVGPLRKTVHVFGDRNWEKRMLRPRISEPQSFERIPLIWERAYGGWDRTHEDPARHGWEPRNPVGVGFHAKKGEFIDGSPLPNLEDPTDPVTRYAETGTPACFGFIGPDWEPRASLAGTYDASWQAHRCPMLPRDFRREFLNAAPRDLVAPRYLRGDEAVDVAHATPEGRLQFRLPGIVPPECLLSLRAGPDENLVTALDTVVIDTDVMHLSLIWRAYTTLWDGPLDVVDIQITCENAPELAQRPDLAEIIPLSVVRA
jgi:hypothetical protein